MRIFFLPVTLMLFTLNLTAQEYRHQNELPLWPHAAPGSNPENWPWEGYKHEWRIDSATGKELSIFVTEPTVQVFLPPEEINTGLAVVICPGGGYNVVVIGKEGYDIAMALNRRGIAAIVLNYRHYDQSAALQDAHRSVQLTRFMADEWKINKNKIGIGGFSAGGHLALRSAYMPLQELNDESDIIHMLNPYPDFLMLVYPAIQFPDKKEHIDKIPPAFITVAANDYLCNGAIELFNFFRKNQIPAELHIFQEGGHGFGAGTPACHCSTWIDLFNNWLEVNGLSQTSY